MTPVEPRVESAWFQRFTPICDEPLSIFGFNFDLRRYTKAAKEAGKILARVQRDGGGGTAAAAAVTLGLEAELLASAAKGSTLFDTNKEAAAAAKRVTAAWKAGPHKASPCNIIFCFVFYNLRVTSSHLLVRAKKCNF